VIGRLWALTSPPSGASPAGAWPASDGTTTSALRLIENGGIHAAGRAAS